MKIENRKKKLRQIGDKKEKSDLKNWKFVEKKILWFKIKFKRSNQIQYKRRKNYAIKREFQGKIFAARKF